MPKASIKLPDGTSVVIEGSPEEVAKLLALYSGASKSSGASVSSQEKKTKKKRTKKPKAKRTNDDFHPVSHLLESMDRTSYTHILDGPRVLERALALLRAAKDDFDIDGLGSTEIAKVLTEKFRLRTTRQAVQQALDAASDKVDRVSPSGSKTYYRIMHPGEVYLDSPQAKTDGKKKSSTWKRATKSKMKGKKKAAATKSNDKSPKSKKKLPTAGTGAVATLSELAKTDFFSKPKTIKDIIEHCSINYARKFRANDLSGKLARMVRNGELARKKNKDKQYEYTKV